MMASAGTFRVPLHIGACRKAAPLVAPSGGAGGGAFRSPRGRNGVVPHFTLVHPAATGRGSVHADVGGPGKAVMMNKVKGGGGFPRQM